MPKTALPREVYSHVGPLKEAVRCVPADTSFDVINPSGGQIAQTPEWARHMTSILDPLCHIPP